MHNHKLTTTGGFVPPLQIGWAQIETLLNRARSGELDAACDLYWMGKLGAIALEKLYEEAPETVKIVAGDQNEFPMLWTDIRTEKKHRMRMIQDLTAVSNAPFKAARVKQDEVYHIIVDQLYPQFEVIRALKHITVGVYGEIRRLPVLNRDSSDQWADVISRYLTMKTEGENWMRNPDSWAYILAKPDCAVERRKNRSKNRLARKFSSIRNSVLLDPAKLGMGECIAIETFRRRSAKIEKLSAADAHDSEMALGIRENLKKRLKSILRR